MKTVSVFFVLILVTQFCVAQITNTEVGAKIKTNFLDDIIEVKGIAANNTEVYKSLKYTLSIIRTNANDGTVSKNSQEDRFTLESNETKELFSVTTENSEKDKIVVLLLISEEENIIGKDRIAFNEKEKKKEVVEEDSDGIELKGIVIEETKTKPGKDFYEMFYNAYTFSQINGNRIVAVYEKLSFGRSTIIQVKIGDKLIHEFLGKPDLEYLEEMSKVALRRVYKYFKDLKNQENSILQY